MFFERLPWIVISEGYQNNTTLLVRSTIKGLENPPIRNLDEGRISSSFVSVRIWIF